MTTDQSFDVFVRSQQADAAAENHFDSARQREEWIGSLAKLYKSIESYLKPYLDNESITLDYFPLDIQEEGIGSYRVSGLNIIIGNKQVEFLPIGTLLVGSKGRVDVKGSAGRARLAFVDKDLRRGTELIRVTPRPVGRDKPGNSNEPIKPPKKIRWSWKIVSAPPDMSFIELNKESFQRMLQEVSSG